MTAPPAATRPGGPVVAKAGLAHRANNKAQPTCTPDNSESALASARAWAQASQTPFKLRKGTWRQK